MKTSMLKMKLLGIVSACILTFGVVNSAQATLLPLPNLVLPLVAFDNTGTTKYDPSTGIIETDALPIAVRFSATTAPHFINPTAGSEHVFINVKVDSSGNLMSGVPGDDLVITGEVDSNGDGIADYAGTLLTAEVLEFGFQNDGTNDLYNYTFSVTGGALAPLYPTGNVGLSVISELSTFTDFTVPFTGRSKGTIGGVPSVVTECKIDILGTCVVEKAPEESTCNAKIAATTLKYTGPTIYGALVELIGKNEGYASYSTDLISGETILVSPEQNGYTIDGRPGDLGSKLSVFINGEEELLHTSCSVPYTVGMPAPINGGSSDGKGSKDSDKGSKDSHKRSRYAAKGSKHSYKESEDSEESDKTNDHVSSNWMVVAFVDKLGEVVEMTTSEPALTCEIPANRSSTVLYGFTVTNSGHSVIDSADVIDSFGVVPNSPLGVLNPGDSATLERTQVISEETENVVSVTGHSAFATCENLTAVTVHQAEASDSDKGSKDKGSKGSKGKGSKDKGSKGSKDKGSKDKNSKGSKDKGSEDKGSKDK